MRIFVVCLLLAALLYYFVLEPFKNRPGHRYRPNWFMVTLLAISLIPTGCMEYQWQAMENKGTQVVKSVSGKEEGHLSCQRFFNTLWDTRVSVQGFVEYDKPNTATMKWKQCKQLQEYFANPLEPTTENTMAMQVLLHESIHVKGNRSESSTECEALQVHQSQAIQLGSYPDSVLINLRHYMRSIYPLMPSEYRSAGNCNMEESLELPNQK